MHLHPAIEAAYAVLDGHALTRAEALALGEVQGPDLLDLVSLANKVRVAFAKPIVPCSIVNAKSGHCSQNCRFCAQAACHNTGIDEHPLMTADALVADARKVYLQGVRTYGIVTGGRGYEHVTPEFEAILEAIDRLHVAFPDLHVCVSLGLLSDETAARLAAHGVHRYNMNLQTAPERYGELIATTHTIEEKVATIRALKRHGIGTCTGGILGLGETWADRVSLAFACRDLDVDGIPLNVLLPIPGTPLEDRPILPPAEVARTFAMVRLVNPTKTLKFAAGRETTMKDFQGLLMLAGMNSFITGGYLTTRGRSVPEDEAFRTALEAFS
ncbi:MAG: biotin synthase BioB [Candidatus Spyradenecus sp.]